MFIMYKETFKTQLLLNDKEADSYKMALIFHYKLSNFKLPTTTTIESICNMFCKLCEFHFVKYLALFIVTALQI